MKSLILFVILLFVFLYLYKKNESFIEKFQNQEYNDLSIDVQNFFKENTDLNYLDIRDQRKLSEMKQRLSNQVAPVIDTKKGKEEKPAALVKDVSSNLTNRVPDDNSNNDFYKIPMPTFDLDHKNFKPVRDALSSNDKLKSQADYEPIIKKIVKNPKYTEKIQKLQEQLEDVKNLASKYKINNNCKFIPSADSNNKCSKSYSAYSGASFSGNDISCGDKELSKKAEGLAIIKDGRVVNVKITDSGLNYNKQPIITFINGGKEGRKASAKGIIKNGKVTDVEIINEGYKYTDTPDVIFEKPETTMYCHLCCKD